MQHDILNTEVTTIDGEKNHPRQRMPERCC